jgi:dipeptidyl-peptidase-4
MTAAGGRSTAWRRGLAWASLALAAALLAPRASRTESPATPPPGGDEGFLAQYAATYRFSLGTPQAYQIVPGGGTVLFLRSGPRSFVRDLWELDVASGQERLAASAEKLLGGGEESLSAEEKARRERSRLQARGIATFDLSEDGSRVLIPISGRLFVMERLSGAVRELPQGPGFPVDARFSPDGRRVACVRGGDLFVIDLASGAQRQLTTGATHSLSHGLAEFVAQEEMGRSAGYWWSPDSATLAYEEADTSKVEDFHIADPMHPERVPDSWPYPRPGRSNAVVRLGLVPAAGGATVWADWDRAELGYLAEASWRKGGPLTILVQNRRQTEEKLLAVDPASGATRLLLAESDPAWLNINPAVPRWLPDGSGFLWISERTGEPRLELCAAQGGTCRWLTPAGFGLRSFAGLQASGAGATGVARARAADGASTPAGAASPADSAYVVASAEPTEQHLWRVPLGGGAPVALTKEPGQHSAVLARDGSASIWSAALDSGERIWSVHRRDGSEAARLRSVAERPSLFPNLEHTTLGPLAFRAVIVRPRDFQAGRKYPVLVSVYGGPHTQVARRDPWAYLLTQWIADHGFVVITLDGRGTPGRGRAWERAIKGNLIDLPLADQVAGLQAAGARYPEMDLGRTGIFGWSFGGYFSAMAAMRRPDVYRAAVAGAPVCDWQDYDTHYTERYLGLPADNPEGYKASSVLTYCPKLSVPLLIVHGTADDNVYLLHSLKMTDALFRAGRTYEFLVLPGFTHMVPDATVQRALQERIVGFFATHLGL